MLPSLALNTARELAELLYEQSDGGENVNQALPVIDRFFTGDIAYFLCCYLVQLAFTVNVLWLLQIPSNFSLFVTRQWALTKLEIAESKCHGPFDFSTHYAYNATVMCMCLLFGVAAPIMWTFAVLYFVFKYFVDLHNIRYVHTKTYNDGRLARRVSQVLFYWTLCAMQGFGGLLYLRKFYTATVGVFCVTTAVLMTQMWLSRSIGPLVLPFLCRWIGTFSHNPASASFWTSADDSSGSLDHIPFEVKQIWPGPEMVMPPSPPRAGASVSDCLRSRPLNGAENDLSSGEASRFLGSRSDSGSRYGSIQLPGPSKS